MKSLTDYMLETQKTYSFKIKLAGEVSTEDTSKLKTALEKFSVVKLSEGKRTPIQKVPLDFPDMQNINVTIFELEIKYPTIANVLAEYISQTLNWPLHCVHVCNDNLDFTPENTVNENLLNTEELGAADSESQSLVGEKRSMDLIKELSKVKHTGEQYKGVNDAILASNLPEETKQTVMDILANVSHSPLGSQQNKLPTPGN